MFINIKPEWLPIVSNISRTNSFRLLGWKKNDPGKILNQRTAYMRLFFKFRTEMVCWTPISSNWFCHFETSSNFTLSKLNMLTILCINEKCRGYQKRLGISLFFKLILVRWLRLPSIGLARMFHFHLVLAGVALETYVLSKVQLLIIIS